MRSIRINKVAQCVAVTLLFATACSGPPPPPPEFQSKPLEGVYRIGPSDIVRVLVWKNPELSVDVPVRPDGKISVPLLDDVQAAGLTTEELKGVITIELNEYITAPDVTVVVLNALSKRIFVVGQVLRSGPIPMANEMRVLEVLSVAGGFGPFADRSDVRVLRVVEGEERVYRFDYDAFMAGNAPGTNIVLHPGDTIVVPD